MALATKWSIIRLAASFAWALASSRTCSRFAYEGFRFVQRSLGGRDLDAVDKKKHPFKGIAVRLRLFPMNFNVIGMVFYILRSYVILRIGR
jgi:hypothetical protein